MTVGRGTRLGSHEIIAQIGAGGMGDVFRAIDTKLGRQVAIKTLPSALAALPGGTCRMRVSALFDSVGRDLRYALRSLPCRPMFTLAVVLTLALGIGAS